ncbi:ANK [Mytilus coruscus]|uniref:ANK n=1 Tax=Mytilus coruscus TaxID=42192 RepID=A0A6J8BZK1_MYTCO|nr:ANK [Mytilus coruscus]
MEMDTDSGLQATAISHEEENYLRFANLLMRVAHPAVRKKFDKEFHPDGLKKVLDQNRLSILEPMKKKKIINQAQWDVLFPKSENVTSKDFDLSLMICLLRHLAEIQVGDKLPFPHDKSADADLTRLKYYRNKVMHSDDGTLLDHSFNSWWDDISQAIIRIGGSSFEEYCKSLKVRKLDSDEREIRTEIKNIRRMFDTVPKGIRKIYERTITEWEKEIVAETRPIRRLAKMIAADNIAVAVGPSGCGKSTAIHYIALQLALLHDYDILIVFDVDEMRQFYNPDSKQVFVIDDVVGAITFNENKATKWLEMSNDINIILEGNQVKLLASSRTHIFQDRMVGSINILSKYSLDFVSSDHCLTRDDRINIANIYLTKDEILSLQICGAFSEFDFFPVLCRYYSNRKSGTLFDFFSNPVKAVTDDLFTLITATDQTTFATLFIFVICNNCIMDSLFSDKLKIKPILEDISDNFCIQSKFSIQVVKDEMEKLRNSYIKKKNSAYTMIHDKIFDILVYFCGKSKIDFMLEIAHTDVIRDRFAFKSSIPENTAHDNVVEIPSDKENNYFDRLKKDIEQGFIKNVFSNRNLKDKSFRLKFITEIAKYVVVSLPEKTIFSLLMSMIDQDLRDIVIILLTKAIKLDQMYWDGETPLFKAACKGYTEVVLLLLKQNADPNFYACFNSLSHIDKMYPGITVNNISDYHYTSQRYSPPPIPTDQMHFDIRFKKASSAPEQERLDHSVTVKSHLINLSNRRQSRFKRNEPYRISPLQIAASKGNTAIVQLLLCHNAEPDCATESNHIASPLYIASNQGYTDIVHLIINSKSNSDVTVSTIQTPKLKGYIQSNLRSSLHAAVEKGHSDIVNILLDHKLNLDQHLDHLPKSTQHVKFNMNFYWDMVAIAIVKDHDELVKVILKKICDSNFCNEKDVLPLFKAICEGKTKIVKLLLEHNFDPNTCYKDNESPLYTATSLGQYKTVKLLLKHNSNPNICNKVSNSPLHIASWTGHTEIVKLLLEYKSDPNILDWKKESVLHVATFKNRIEIVKLLLQHKVHTDICNIKGQSALHIASVRGRTEIAKLLLENNCDRNLCNKDGESPLFVAVQSMYDAAKLVKLLLDHNSDPNLCDKDNCSPLFVASMNGNTEIVKLLLDHGCDSSVCNNKNKNPLFIASKKNNIKIVKLLLDHNCDPNVCNEDGKSPLFEATSNGSTKVVWVLLCHSSDPNICNKYGISPLFLASSEGHSEIVKLLLHFKSDPYLCNKNNQSPLYAAIQNGQKKAVKLLLHHFKNSNVNRLKRSKLPILLSRVPCSMQKYSISARKQTEGPT